MKPYLLALSLLLAGTSASAQQQKPEPLTLSVDNKTHQITYSGIIAEPSAAKSELYARGKIWFATVFAATPSATQLALQADDKEAGLLVASGVAATHVTYGVVPVSNQVVVQYTLTLSFQEGNYSYSLTDFRFLSGEPTHPSQYLPFPYNLFYSSYHIISAFRSQSVLPGQPGNLVQTRYSVEEVCLAKRPDGTPTHQAVKFSQGLDQIAQRLVSSLESGMSKAAGGSDW